MNRLETGVSHYYAHRFEGLNLAGETIEALEFEDCEFKDCDWSGARLSRCRFVGCEFINCNLSVIDIRDSQFKGLVVRNSKAIGINWANATWPKLMGKPLAFHNCVIHDSSFVGLRMEGLTIEDCKAHGVDFEGGNFSGATLCGTDFDNSLFENTNLAKADFRNATNYRIDLYKNEIKGAKFSCYEALRLLDCLEIELVD
jgi:fluoroquinolone resistance protein